MSLDIGPASRCDLCCARGVPVFRVGNHTRCAACQLRGKRTPLPSVPVTAPIDLMLVDLGPTFREAESRTAARELRIVQIADRLRDVSYEIEDGNYAEDALRQTLDDAGWLLEELLIAKPITDKAMGMLAASLRSVINRHGPNHIDPLSPAEQAMYDTSDEDGL